MITYICSHTLDELILYSYLRLHPVLNTRSSPTSIGPGLRPLGVTGGNNQIVEVCSNIDRPVETMSQYL
jgi:hypothetical protein